MIEFKSTEIQHIKHLRISYLYEIKMSQELFLETMIRDSSCYKIYESSHEIGYFILNRESILLEFYLVTEVLFKKEAILKQIIDQYNVLKIYCKSFDQVLLTCSNTFSHTNRIILTLFRDYTKGLNLDYENQFKVRLATKSDPILLGYDDSGNYNAEILKYTIINHIVYLFEKDNSVVGCGSLTKIMPDKNFHNIEMWVKPDFRRQGYGAMIVSYLKRHCFSHNYTPVCGCNIDNIASRKTFEKNGFISKHCIIEFSISK